MAGPPDPGSARGGPRGVRGRSSGLLPRRTAVEGLVSVAGLTGAPITTSDGAEVGRVVDVVALPGGTAAYPAVTGIVARVGRRHAFMHAEQIAEISPGGIRLASAKLDLREFARRPGEVLLARDVIDHQLVDVDGARVVRAADLYLARTNSAYHLVGVDVGIRTFLRRVGPARLRRTPAPERVIDWADVEPFSAPGAPVRLRAPHRRLRELRPAELADLLEDLGRAQRRELLTALTPETAADALEEMQPGELTELLRDAPVDRAADLLARMEPDEAVDALRDLSDSDRATILAAMPAPVARVLSGLLAYPERQAGGFMTTHLVLLHATDTIETARRALRERHRHGSDIDAVVIVDDEGRLVDDVPLLDLIVAEPDARIGDLVGPPWPATVTPDAGTEQVVEQLVSNRGVSLLVVDPDDRPLGRILADDVLDVLTVGHARRWPWQQR